MFNTSCKICAAHISPLEERDEAEFRKNPPCVIQRNLNMSQMRNMMIDDLLKDVWIEQNYKIIRQLSVILKASEEKVIKFLYKLTLSNFSKALNEKSLSWKLSCSVPLMHNNSCDAYLSIFDIFGNVRNPLRPGSLWSLFKVMQIILNQDLFEEVRLKQSLFEVIGRKAPRCTGNADCYGGCDPTGIFKQKKSYDYYCIDGRFHDLTASDLIGYGANIANSKAANRVGGISEAEAEDGIANNNQSNMSRDTTYDDELYDYKNRRYQMNQPNYKLRAKGIDEQENIERNFALGTDRRLNNMYEINQNQAIDRLYASDQQDIHVDNSYGINQYNQRTDTYGIDYQNVRDSITPNDAVLRKQSNHRLDRLLNQNRNYPDKRLTQFEKRLTFSKGAHGIIDVIRKANRGGLVTEDIDELIRAIKVVDLTRENTVKNNAFGKKKKNFHHELKTQDAIDTSQKQKPETISIHQVEQQKEDDKQPVPSNKYKGTSKKFLGATMPVLMHEPFNEEKPWTWLKRHPKQPRISDDGKIVKSGLIRRYRRDSVEKKYQQAKRRISFQSTISKVTYNAAPMFGSAYVAADKKKKEKVKRVNKELQIS